MRARWRLGGVWTNSSKKLTGNRKEKHGVAASGPARLRSRILRMDEAILLKSKIQLGK